MTEEMASETAGYVEQGGTIIGTARMGMLGKHGWYNHQMPCAALQKVFGIDAREVCSGVTPEITYQRKVYQGGWHKEILRLLEKDVEVLARFEDDLPAVTRHAYGKGTAVYFATHPDAAWLENASYLLWDILDRILPELGIYPKVELFFSQRHLREFDGNLIEDEKEGYLIITSSFTKNYSYSANERRLVDVVVRTEREIVRVEGLVNGEAYDFRLDAGELRFSLQMEKNCSEVVRIEYK